MTWGFVIEQDHTDVAPGDGAVGQHAGALAPDEIVAHPAREGFTLWDDDGYKYYSGTLVDDEGEGWYAAFKWGWAYAGCTHIKDINGEWVIG